MMQLSTNFFSSIVCHKKAMTLSVFASIQIDWFVLIMKKQNENTIVLLLEKVSVWKLLHKDT